MREASQKLQDCFRERSMEFLVALQEIIDAEVASREADLKEYFEKSMLAAYARLEEEKREIQKQKDKLDNDRRGFEIRVQEFESERTWMLKHASSGDILHLNIAGELTRSVLRSTLCIIEGSMLAARFSGRWDGGGKDVNGCFFINFAPDIFLPLLDFLVQTQVETSSSCNPALYPHPPPEKVQDFMRMVHFYGLGELFPQKANMVLEDGDASLDVENLSVQANKWSTVSLHVHKNSMLTILNYEVVGELASPQIGWVNADFRATAGHGVGDDCNGWALDGVQKKFWHVIGHNVAVFWRNGDTLRCCLDQKECKMRWYVNERLVYSVPLPDQQLRPAVSARGRWTFRLLDQ